MKVITKDKLNKMWSEIISTKTAEHPIFLISDVDGTLVETDPSLIKAVKESRYCSFMIATGRPVDERKNSTKFQGRQSLGTNCPIIIGQGGSVTCVNTGDSENFYIVPIQHDMESIVDTIAEGLGVDRKTLFREEMLCMHHFSEGREVIAIPIALEDEPYVAQILEQYNGNIVDAVKANALPCYDIAIREYLERGKPEWEIAPLYESDIPNKLYTELTIVGPDLELVKTLLWERFEISIGIQHQIADRYIGTRFTDDVHPDIADVTSCTKQDHVKAIIDVVRERKGITIGLGDQYNDDHLTVTDYSFVADADGAIESSSAWNFAIEMAKKADDLCKRGTKVIHAEHRDGLLINWAVKAVIEAAEGGFEEARDLLESLANSEENLAKRKRLQKESTK